MTERTAIVTTEMMLAVIAKWGQKSQKKGPVGRDDAAKAKGKVAGWIQRHGIAIGKESTWKGDGYRWELAACPFNPDHVLGEAFVAVQPSGARVAGCLHDSCQWGWRELRELYDGSTGDTVNLTDLGNANRLVERHIDELRFCPTRTVGWLAWDGTRWADDSAGRAMEAGKETALSIYTEAALEPDPDRRKSIVGWAKQSESYARVSSMVNFARTDPHLVVEHSDLDRDPWSLNVSNGTVDLAAGTLRPHSMGDMITKLAPVTYDADARSEEWDRFLERVLPDEAVRAYVQRLFGCAAVGMSNADTLPILYGSGANGKSTLLEAVRKVMGEYALAANPDLLLMSKHREHATEHARLAGARLITTVEVGQGRRLNEAIVKQLTGGDRMTGRFMRQNYFEFDPTWLIMMATNHKPVITGADDGIWRRVSLVPFTVTIPAAERDATLRDRLPVEAGSAILNWIIEGCLAWRRDGLCPPEAVLAATAAYRGESDILGQFLSDCCDIGPQASELFANLHRAYESWAEDSGYEVETTSAFGRLLTERGFASRKVTKGPDRNKAEREGLKLKSGGTSPGAKRDDASPDSDTESQSTSTKCVLRPVASKVPITHVARAHKESNWKYGSNQAQTAVALLPFDLETAGTDGMWSDEPGFVRLVGYRSADGIVVTTDPRPVLEAAAAGATLVGHNIWNFDLPVLAQHHGLDLTTVAAIDTKLLAVLADPPEARMSTGEVERRYALDALGAELLGHGKTGDLKALAREFGGFGEIPTDDPRYLDYVKGDVEVTAALAERFGPLDAYASREHEVARLAAVMSMNGFRVDTELLAERVAAGDATRTEMLERLSVHGLPTTKKDGKPCKAPHATEEGKKAIVAAFAELGVRVPRTQKDHPAFDQKAMDRVIAKYPHARDLAETIKSLNGIRTVNETVAANLHGDRVHPAIDFRQASGRWSITKPGLTVMGKRGGRHKEREIFLAEEGHVMISADLSQVDARAVAAHSQDPNYLSLFEPGRDAHAEIARRIWGDPTRREEGKALGHGFNYGEGPSRIAREAGVTEEFARDFHWAMCVQFPLVVEWQNCMREIADAGELLENGFGRRMRVTPGRSWTQAPALVGQACARDLMMEGLLRLDRAVWPYLRAVVHDELVLSVPLDIVDDVEREVIRALSFEWAPPGKERTVQIVAGLVGRGRSWGAVYEKGDG